LKFLQRGLQAGIGNFRSKNGAGHVAAAVAIAVSLSLAPMPADGSRPRHLPYPQLAWPLVISGSQYAPAAWADIAGWNEDNHLAAFKTFRTSCKAISAQPDPAADPKATNPRATDPRATDPRALGISLREPCRAARAADVTDNAKAGAFFEEHFRPLQISRLGEDAGFVTGYYEPVVD
jgi:membrane-bound lytic murein transglycosylase A